MSYSNDWPGKMSQLMQYWHECYDSNHPHFTGFKAHSTMKLMPGIIIGLRPMSKQVIGPGEEHSAIILLM